MSIVSTSAQPAREATHAVDPLIISRWSPRAMSGEAIDDDALMPLFEAARWAPSSYNNQPWRFLYARRDTPHWDGFLDLLVEQNRAWARDAAVLLVVLSKTTFDSGKPSQTHTFDTGAAWQNLALQATRLGLVAHGMEGFDHERARRDLGVPDEYTVEAMVAIGVPGDVDDLPEKMAARERPSSRKPIDAIAAEGPFAFAAT